MFIILKSTPFYTLLSSDLYKHSDNVTAPVVLTERTLPQVQKLSNVAEIVNNICVLSINLSHKHLTFLPFRWKGEVKAEAE